MQNLLIMKNTTIYSDKATYLKMMKQFLRGNSKAINENNIITGSNFKFDKIKNILNAEGNVEFIDNEKIQQSIQIKPLILKMMKQFYRGNSKAINENNIITGSNLNLIKLKIF